MLSGILLCALAAIVFMSAVFLFARRKGRYDVVDAAWGSCFVVVALVSFFLQPGESFKADLQVLATTLVVIWGARLTGHIVERVRRTDREDPRYVELRKAWKGSVAANTYVRIYLMQAVLAVLICTPVLYINLSADTAITALAWVGVVVWGVGFVFESVGDSQLRRFVSNPQNRGKIMDRGLWRYTRHPNYFGELTQWWGVFLLCVTLPGGWVTVVGPLLLSYLIVFVSGIPPNERRFKGRPGWDVYKKRTSVLLPLPPRT